MPRQTTPEAYVLGQVAEAEQQADKNAKWYYDHKITEDPAIGPLDYPKSKQLLVHLQNMAKERHADMTNKVNRDRKNSAKA